MIVTVKRSQVSTGWTFDKKGDPVRHAGFATSYVVLVDGKRVDSFLSRENAERKARQLRQGGSK